MDFSAIKQNLERLEYTVSAFGSAAEATEYMAREITGKTVGFGGSMTVGEMGLFPALKDHNDVTWHMQLPEGMTAEQARERANGAQIYISSVNGIAETGEIINIDGTCNRVSAIYYGHEKVYLVVGKNKIAPDYEAALWRARNVAAPKNARRLGVKTPCAEKADRCYDCKGATRICRGLSVLWRKPTGCEYEIILIDEELGY